MVFLSPPCGGGAPRPDRSWDGWPARHCLQGMAGGGGARINMRLEIP